MAKKKSTKKNMIILVVIILALVVLAAIIMNFKQEISNLPTIVESCNSACAAGISERYNYCSLQRDVIFDSGEKQTLSCVDLEVLDIGVSCPAIDCEIPTDCVEMNPDRNRLVEITDTVTGCNADENEIISSDTVAAGGADKTVVCCQSQ